MAGGAGKRWSYPSEQVREASRGRPWGGAWQQRMATFRGHPSCNTTVPVLGLDYSQGQGLPYPVFLAGAAQEQQAVNPLISVLPLTLIREILHSYYHWYS